MPADFVTALALAAFVVEALFVEGLAMETLDFFAVFPTVYPKSVADMEVHSRPRNGAGESASDYAMVAWRR